VLFGLLATKLSKLYCIPGLLDKPGGGNLLVDGGACMAVCETRGYCVAIAARGRQGELPLQEGKRNLREVCSG